MVDAGFIGNLIIAINSYEGRFATTIFSATKLCNIVANTSNIVPTLQSCVALKIVVANCFV